MLDMMYVVVVLQSDTEFWDKMQAEWEELARRNWLEDSEDPRPIPPSVSPVEKVKMFILIFSLKREAVINDDRIFLR